MTRSSTISLQRGPEGSELRMPQDRPGQGVRSRLEGISVAGHPINRLLRGCPGPVVDATAGLGGDTAVVAALGRRVLAIERDPDLVQLLREALERVRDPGLSARIDIHHADALDLLPALPEMFQRPAAVILDPMYPPRRSNSALPPKPMQALRLMFADSPEEPVAPLVSAAFEARPRRVLLKRPPEAPCATERPPTFSIGSKLVRWDAWELG